MRKNTRGKSPSKGIRMTASQARSWAGRKFTSSRPYTRTGRRSMTYGGPFSPYHPPKVKPRVRVPKKALSKAQRDARAIYRKALRERKAAMDRMKRYGKRTAARKAAARRARKPEYLGPFPRAYARIGSATFKPTYAYESRSGRLRHIPLWAQLGFKSAASYRKALADEKSARGAAARKKRSRIMSRRSAAAKRVSRSGGLFTPNRTLTFDEWEKTMRKNPKRRRKARRRTTKRRSAMSLYLANARRSKRRSVKRRSRVTASSRRRTVKRRTTKRRVVRRASAKRVRRNPKRRVRRTTTRRRVRRATARRRPVRRVRRYRRNTMRKNARTKSRRFTIAGRAVRKRGSKRSYRVTGAGLYLQNKRRSRKRRRSAAAKFWGANRRYRRNALMSGSFMNQLKSTLIVGGFATLGYVAHRAGSKLVRDLAFKDASPDSIGAKYGDLIAAAAVGLLTIPAAVKLAPADSKFIAAGIGVSFLQKLIMWGASKLDTSGKYAPYLQGIGEYYKLPASGMGAYYRYPAAGLGSYYQYPTGGLGQIRQAAAGMGQLRQAAAGMGQIQQAAAGMGQLRQAAAGVGEYIASGVQAIGEYEEVTPEYTRPIPVNEGIAPNLTSAERALSYAEAVHGVSGNAGTEMVPTVEPVDPSLRVGSPDEPAGSRLGTFGGANGVFGPFMYE